MDYIKLEELEKDKKVFCDDCDTRAEITITKKVDDKIEKKHLCFKHFKKELRKFNKSVFGR